MFNRPISPHLTIYTPQVSSLLSIWHRITGILITGILITSLLVLQLILLTYSFKYSILISVVLILEYSWIVILLVFIYHLLNGLKHIIWDLGFFLNKNSLNLLFIIISGLLSLIFLLVIKI
uniref:Succinate dehydrogenase subunit 3 n=1 Tax=Melanthalia intermedia TaxID=172989 RepID=A0A345UBP2_9FLOR|nr:succinate dehydrogenase subunit 3 [Melanthalia intermedia]AXI97878.1 succinate dehydrogenase subunit 3 [Melanthalia intermedia]